MRRFTRRELRMVVVVLLVVVPLLAIGWWNDHWCLEAKLNKTTYWPMRTQALQQVLTQEGWEVDWKSEAGKVIVSKDGRHYSKRIYSSPVDD